MQPLSVIPAADGQDAQFGRKSPVRTHRKTRRLFEQLVDPLYEVGEDAEERFVEDAVEVAVIAVHIRRRPQFAHQGLRTVGFGGFSQFHPVFVDPADVMRGELHVAEHITVFDLVGIAQMVVHDPELFVAFVKPPVDFVNQGGVAPQPPVLALRVEQQPGL